MPVSFEFKSVINKNYKMIIFNLNRSESCGDQIASFQRSDTLVMVQKNMLYKEGKPYNEESSDRFQDLEDMSK